MILDLEELKVWVGRQEGFCFPYEAKLLASLVFEPLDPGFNDRQISYYFQNVICLNSPKWVSSPNVGRCSVDFAA